MIEIKVAELPRALSWYTETLGLNLLIHDPARRFALLEAGAARLALKERPGASPDREAVQITFEVPDLLAEQARLLGAGQEVSAPIENAAEGYREVRLLDPDGTRIALFSWSHPAP